MTTSRGGNIPHRGQEAQVRAIEHLLESMDVIPQQSRTDKTIHTNDWEQIILLAC